MPRSWHELQHPRRPAGAPGGRGGEWVGSHYPTSWESVVSGQVGGTPLWRDQRKLEWLAGQTPTFRSRVSGGGVATTQRLTYGDGDYHLIRKKFSGTLVGRRASAEILASRVAETVGAPAPVVIQDPDDRHAVLMGHVPGDLGDTHYPNDPEQRAIYYYAQTDAGLRIGLLDVLVRNEDRHKGNWIMSSEIPVDSPFRRPGEDQLRSPIAIDHSEAFQDPDSRQYGARTKEDWDAGRRFLIPWDDAEYMGFADAWLIKSPNSGGADFVRSGRISYPEYGGFYREKNPLHPDDIPVLRARLRGLRREFETRGMASEYARMMERFAGIAAHAAGTRRMFP